MELRHTRLNHFKDTVINSAGIVGCLTATKKGHPRQAMRNITKKETLQNMPVIVHQGLYERKPVALELHSDKVVLCFMLTLTQRHTHSSLLNQHQPKPIPLLHSFIKPIRFLSLNRFACCRVLHVKLTAKISKDKKIEMKTCFSCT